MEDEKYKFTVVIDDITQAYTIIDNKGGTKIFNVCMKTYILFDEIEYYIGDLIYHGPDPYNQINWNKIIDGIHEHSPTLNYLPINIHLIILNAYKTALTAFLCKNQRFKPSNNPEVVEYIDKFNKLVF